ncbi:MULTISPECIES: CsbD family protein [Arthrobacter]|uniref:CsbD family protein n=1 Tax=Arthrobacter terricola TaxID=2547396 RepID=A0A4R5KAV2_9MICC|nr:MULTISPECIES: CsbD family protein [Arthrobacter]MBT8162947.1 CsbD family protein [Arthrobacter sp. GN70]TDF91645.1 CsbD family protein [Arthrobacter terricola]
MGLGDKLKHAAEETAGKIKEKAGHATGNVRLEAEGKAQQAAAHVKDAKEAAGDIAEDIADRFTED